MASTTDSTPGRLQRLKPPPIDLSVIPSGAGPSAPQRIQLWPTARSVHPEAETGPGSPTPLNDGGISPGVALSPLVGEPEREGGWAGLPAHLLELIFAALRDSQGRWPSRKILFGVCGVCRLWRRVGHTLFFSNVWHNHSDVIVHPSQLFSLSPHPLRLQTSDHLLRCFVQRTPCATSGVSPRLGRLWRFSLYLGADHRGLLRSGAVPGPGQGPGFGAGPSGGGGGGGGSGGAGMTGGGGGSSAVPQLLMTAQQNGRRSYQLLLSPGGGDHSGGGTAAAAQGWGGWRSPPRDPGGGRGGNGGNDGEGGGGAGWGGWRTPQPHTGVGGGGGAGGGGRAVRDVGVVAVLRSNIRCSQYELLPESSCPWARRLISVAGYNMSPQGGLPQPLIQLEYRLRVRGIMLPRRMKVQVPVPHSLQRVVHNPLYDLHEPVGDGPSPTAAGWPPVFGAAGPAVMAPPPPGAAAGLGAHPVVPLPDGAGGGGALGGPEGQQGLMDNLEDILEVAVRQEPVLLANMVDAAVVRPTDDEDPGLAAAGGRPPNAGGGRAAAVLRRTGSMGSALLRGLLLNRLPSGGGDAAAAAAGGDGQAGGGTVQWWGPGSPGGSWRTLGSGRAAAAGCGGAGGSDSADVAGWVPTTPQPVRVVRLQNKAPHWNDSLMCWCLNFRGRVKMASVKNFQLMCSADASGRCVMQFGKVEEGVYILDFNPCVLTAAQAFAAALSTFETKYLL